MEILAKLELMDSHLLFAKTAYIEAHQLLPLLSDYTNPRDWISQMVKKGELMRLKNGFFIIREKIQNEPIPYPQIANLLYGPSYVSLEWALSYYGMIPEGVYVMTSVSLTKSKNFNTPVGVFDYNRLSQGRYATGIDQQENNAGRFLIATPEKALSDLVHFKSRKLAPEELLKDLIEGRRIELESLKNLNKQHLFEIAKNYRSQAVNRLTQALGLL